MTKRSPAVGSTVTLGAGLGRRRSAHPRAALVHVFPEPVGNRMNKLEPEIVEIAAGGRDTGT